MLIGKVEIKTPIILAPMAGVTDYPFRVLCRKMGAGAVYSEFVSSEGIIRENQKTLDMIKFHDFERPIGIQIFGNNPSVMGKAAKYVVDNFKPDIFAIAYASFVFSKFFAIKLFSLIGFLKFPGYIQLDPKIINFLTSPFDYHYESFQKKVLHSIDFIKLFNFIFFFSKIFFSQTKK